MGSPISPFFAPSRDKTVTEYFKNENRIDLPFPLHRKKDGNHA